VLRIVQPSSKVFFMAWMEYGMLKVEDGMDDGEVRDDCDGRPAEVVVVSEPKSGINLSQARAGCVPRWVAMQCGGSSPVDLVSHSCITFPYGVARLTIPFIVLISHRSLDWLFGT
jgi:hypothetical protein